MVKLKIRCWINGCVLFGRIEKMDEKLRTKGVLFDKDGFRISSRWHPCFNPNENSLFVWGNIRDKDNDILFYEFSHVSDLYDYVEKMRKAVLALNGTGEKTDATDFIIE